MLPKQTNSKVYQHYSKFNDRHLILKLNFLFNIIKITKEKFFEVFITLLHFKKNNLVKEHYFYHTQKNKAYKVFVQNCIIYCKY